MPRRSLVLVAAASLASAACETHQCDTSTVVYGDPIANQPPGSSVEMTPGGEMIWRSSPAEGPWLDFPGNRTYVFTYPEPFACEPPMALPQLSAGDVPAPSSISGGAGLAIFANNVPDEDGLYRSITVTNSTCGEYWLNLVMTGTPVGAPCSVQVFGVDAAPQDAGPDATTDDATTDDATTE